VRAARKSRVGPAAAARDPEVFEESGTICARRPHEAPAGAITYVNFRNDEGHGKPPPPLPANLQHATVVTLRPGDSLSVENKEGAGGNAVPFHLIHGPLTPCDPKPLNGGRVCATAPEAR
jgi:hypothetical protein